MRIGFVSVSGGDTVAAQLVDLLPADCWLDVMTIPQATRAVAEGGLAVLVLAMDGEDWHADLARVMDMHAVGIRRPLAVFALVPRDQPGALAEAFDLNVADVAQLPIDPSEVRARLNALVRRRAVAFARAAEQRAVWRLATLDPVTGLYNRHFIDTLLPGALDRSRQSGRPLAVLMADLDGLKPINDRWGHAAGDRALKAVADIMRERVRIGDTVARIGGDEMLVVMPDADLATARGMAVRLLRAVGLAGEADAPDRLTVSIGLAMLEPGDDTPQKLLVRADAALYAAKREGRNRISEAA